MTSQMRISCFRSICIDVRYPLQSPFPLLMHSICTVCKSQPVSPISKYADLCRRFAGKCKMGDVHCSNGVKPINEGQCSSYQSQRLPIWVLSFGETHRSKILSNNVPKIKLEREFLSEDSRIFSIFPMHNTNNNHKISTSM